MRKLASLALALVASLSLFCGSDATAGTVTLTNPNNGSPYYADFSDDAYQDQLTFCVEAGVPFGTTTAYSYTVDTVIRGAGGATKSLDERAAYLFTLFATNGWAAADAALVNAGFDDGIAYLANSATYRAALQDAIWSFVGDLGSLANSDTLAGDFWRAATFATTYPSGSPLWDGLGNVRVLNITSGGADAQSQLIYVPPTGVPEPGTLALAGLGLGAFVLRRRRS